MSHVPQRHSCVSRWDVQESGDARVLATDCVRRIKLRDPDGIDILNNVLLFQLNQNTSILQNPGT